MGKFQTSVVGETWLLEVICEMPSSRPCGGGGENHISGAMPYSCHTRSAARAALQGQAGNPYSGGNPVLAVDEAELAVEIVKPGELRGDGRRQRDGPTGTEGQGEAALPGLEPRPGRG